MADLLAEGLALLLRLGECLDFDCVLPVQDAVERGVLDLASAALEQEALGGLASPFIVKPLKIQLMIRRII